MNPLKLILLFTLIIVQPVSAQTPKTENINKQKLLTLVNQYRKKGSNCGEKYYPPGKPVVWNNILQKAAKNHSKYMNKIDSLTHFELQDSIPEFTGTSPFERVENVGYKADARVENIAKGYPSEKEVMEGWIKSPGHCTNIMDKDFKEMGIDKIGNYWTQVFAIPEIPKSYMKTKTNRKKTKKSR